MAKGSAIKWVLATAGGAVVGALAIRALDKYVLSKEKDDEPRQLPEQTQQMASPFGIAGFSSPIMPVFLPVPSMYQTAAPPMPPSMSPPGRFPAPEEVEERDPLDEIMEEWDD